MLTKYINPTSDQFPILIARPTLDSDNLMSGIRTIFQEVKRSGDDAVTKYTALFDHVHLASFLCTQQEFDTAASSVSEELKSAIDIAVKNISTFHQAQKVNDFSVETMPGVTCSQKSVPIQKVGLYIPGGSAPLFSTVLMLGIPAKIAGCTEVVLCTPPDRNGNINPIILYAAQVCGIAKVYKVGGSQAIAAMTFGTLQIPKVDKIFGPGNQYVTMGKQIAQTYGVAIDMPAGPSEVLVYADESAIPSFVASDLLAQAEHGGDSQVILVTNTAQMIDMVNESINTQIELLPRKTIIGKALNNSKAILIDDVNSAFEFINAYAPEHLIIASDHPEKYTELIKNAGSVFLGNFCPESAGDYASGTNHTLPTNGWAKAYSGVGLDSFFKKISFQSISQSGLSALSNTIITMATGEQLEAHANAVKIRLSNSY